MIASIPGIFISKFFDDINFISSPILLLICGIITLLFNIKKEILRKYASGWPFK